MPRRLSAPALPRRPGRRSAASRTSTDAGSGFDGQLAGRLRERAELLLEAAQRLLLRHQLDRGHEPRCRAASSRSPRAARAWRRRSRYTENSAASCHRANTRSMLVVSIRNPPSTRNAAAIVAVAMSAGPVAAPQAGKRLVEEVSKRRASLSVVLNGATRGAFVGVDQPAVIQRDRAAAHAANQFAIVGRHEHGRARARSLRGAGS